jgi:peptidyl-prolyl cis-trans isomerase A (cyclophilin A)
VKTFSLEFWSAQAETLCFGIINLPREKENSMLLRALSLTLVASLFLAIVPGLAVSQEAVNPNTDKLMNPALLNEKAPETFQVKFDTTKGEFILDVTRAWAPNGADRFYSLVKNGFLNDSGFFRVVEGFMVQFGVSNDPKVSRALGRATITDDPVKQSNKRGFITYAMGGPNTRTTQVFISYIDNSRLDSMGFAPFGKVTKGMNVVDSIYSGYGDMPSQGGAGPDPSQIAAQGNAYLHKAFPKLDYIKSATIVQAK